MQRFLVSTKIERGQVCLASMPPALHQTVWEPFRSYCSHLWNLWISVAENNKKTQFSRAYNTIIWSSTSEEKGMSNGSKKKQEKESILRSHNQASRSYVRAAPLSLERFAWPYRCSRHIERVAFDWRDISPRFPHIPWQSQTQTFIGSRKAVVVVKAPTSKARGIPKANLPLLLFHRQSQSPQERFWKVFKGALWAEMENTNFP